MWHAPIHGSQINQPAKLYKRFTPTETIELQSGDVITYENNYYITHFAFAWVEADDMQLSEERPISGLIAHTNRMSIKFHGRWKPKAGGVNEPESGDILVINGERWIIEEGSQRARNKSLRDFATVYLPIRKLL